MTINNIRYILNAEQRSSQKSARGQQTNRDEEIKLFNGYDTEAEYKALGLINHTGQGQKVKGKYRSGKQDEYTVIGQCQYGRVLAKSKDGQLVVIAHDGTILKSEYATDDRILKSNQATKDRKAAEKLADEFYQITDNSQGINSMKQMQTLLDKKINPNNIVAFLDAYDREKTKKGDSSIIDTITSEIGAGGTVAQKRVLLTLMNKLCLAAQKAGVPKGDIEKARKDFETSLNKEFSANFRRTNPKDMEKAIDFLRGAIAAKTNKGEGMSDADAMREVQNTFAQENEQAQTDYKNAREAEGWAARAGDTVCGWFGCNTIADMDKKLGTNAAAVKKLASSKTEAEFKKNYKEIFGIDFDASKVAARQTAIDKYNQAQNFNSTFKISNNLLKKFENDKSQNSYALLRSGIKTGFSFNNSEVDNIINAYAIKEGIQNPTNDQKRELLLKFLRETKDDAQLNFAKVSGGKTLEQMGKDVDLITRSAFGTSDIVKDVIQFNQNQQTVEMVTEAAAEIAGTIALQFVPGLGQMAAAKLAVSAAKWGTKAVRVANFAAKTEKAMSVVSKAQQGKTITAATTRGAKVVNKGVQVATAMATTGIATAAVDLSDKKSVKDTAKKALMNMSFAGVGATSSILAPKLMQAFGIADKALATEIAEEIINAAGSYGVTKLEGGEYGKTDAFIDFASGIIISRISHVNAGNSHPIQNPNQTGIIADTPEANHNATGTRPVEKGEAPQTAQSSFDWDDLAEAGDVSGWDDLVAEPGGLFGKKKLPEPPKRTISITAYNPKTGKPEVCRVTPEDLAGKLAELRSRGLKPTGTTNIETGEHTILVEQPTSQPHTPATPPAVPKANSSHTPQLDTELRNAQTRSHRDAAISNKVGRNDTKITELNNIADIANINEGGVCSVNGILYVKENGTAKTLDMDKETFERLFPTNGFTMARQTEGNICILFSSMNGMTDSGFGRAQLYQMIHQLPNGDIQIQLHNANPITFRGGKPISLETGLGSEASQGFEMVEQAVLCQYAPELTNGGILSDNDATRRILDRVARYDMVYDRHDVSDHLHYLMDINNEDVNFVNTYKNGTEYKENVEDILNNFKQGDIVVASWESSGYGNHARNITAYDPATKTVTYHDPYHAGVDISCSLDEFLADEPMLRIVKQKAGR